ncbi:probable Sn1-specific diacylglycerol lipase alpha [Coccomyxa sp. Obi]|nr:probable Sn1-specific diacylglycerol lipase alpha [Coccomyxa sp. Obi]
MAVFLFSFVAEVLLTGIGCRGTPLETSKRRAVVPILYVQSVNWSLQAIFMVYGTVVVSRVEPSCWEGSDRRHVLAITQAMVYSTWVFSVVLWLAVFIVYNAYPVKAKEKTWEKRVVCVSWLFGCYKTMRQQVDGRSAPLNSVAQWLSGLFGHADLTPSDLIAALVLCTAAQHQRRRLHIKNALAPVEDALSGITLSESNESADMGGARDDGAQMYTGIDERTLLKKTSDKSSVSTTPSRPSSASPEQREGRPGEVRSSPSSALRHSLESKRKASVDHKGHMQGIVEASSFQEATASLNSNSNHQPGQVSVPENDAGPSGNAPTREPAAPDQAADGAPEQAATGGTGQPEQVHSGGSAPPEEGVRGNAAVMSLLETSMSAVSGAAGAIFGNGSEAQGQASEQENGEQSSGADSRDGKEPREAAGNRGGEVTCNGTGGNAAVDAASDESEAGSEGEEGRAGGIGSKLKQLRNHLSPRDGAPDRRSETGSQDDEEEGEQEKLHLPEELKEKLKEKVRIQSKSARHAEAVNEVAAGPKITAPDKDTTVVPLPHSNGHSQQHQNKNQSNRNSQGSCDIGPIWSERDSSGHGTQQAGGAERVGDEESNDGSSAEAAPRGVLAAVGDYLGSWVGMAPVPEDPEEQEPDEKLMAVPDIPGENPDQSQHEAADGDSELNRRGSVTLNLSEVDAQTLRDFEKRASTAADGTLDDAMEDFRRSRQFPDSRRISNQFPVILTPSEQVSEQVEELNIDMQPGEIVDDILGKRKNVAYDTLEEAAVYAKFACAAYAVVEYEDTRDDKLKSKLPSCCACCGCCPCCSATQTVESSDEVRRTIAEVAGVDEKDILYFSPSNQALAHLPYCIALDKKRKSVVVAIRGTMSMADVVTDAVVHPEGIDDWLPPALSKANKHKRGTAFGHAGIVASASAVLADLDKGGILRVLLGGDEEREAMDEEGGAENKGEAVGAVMQEKVDAKGYRLVVTGHSLGAGAAALISLKLRDRFEDLKCWAYCPPGGLVSESLLPAMREWCVSVVCGKDAVPRMTVNNLSRLMDEMVTALARTRHHKLRVLIGGWWRKENRPPPQHLFCEYEEIPLEARVFLEKYYKSVERRGKEMDMFPPGRVIFVRPLKTLVGRRHRAGPKRFQKGWDAVWITPQELIAEGILISGRMMEHHLLQSTLQGALDHVIEKHPANPNPKKTAKRRRLRKKADQPKDLVELAQVVVEGPERQSPL